MTKEKPLDEILEGEEVKTNKNHTKNPKESMYELIASLVVFGVAGLSVWGFYHGWNNLIKKADEKLIGTPTMEQAPQTETYDPLPSIQETNVEYAPTQTVEIIPTETSQPEPTAESASTTTSKPTSITSYDSAGVWFDQENPTASVIEKTVKEGEILFISAGGFIEGNNRCDYATRDEQICIYIKEIAQDGVLTISNLVPGQALISRIRGGTLEGVLEGTEPYFWIPYNCGDGCSWARVIRETKDGCVEKFILYPNGYRDYLTEQCVDFEN